MEFFMAMNPPTITHQEKQVHVVNGKPVFYEPDELKATRQKLEAHLGKHVPKDPLLQGNTSDHKMVLSFWWQTWQWGIQDNKARYR